MFVDARALARSAGRLREELNGRWPGGHGRRARPALLRAGGRADHREVCPPPRRGERDLIGVILCARMADPRVRLGVFGAVFLCPNTPGRRIVPRRGLRVSASSSPAKAGLLLGLCWTGHSGWVPRPHHVMWASTEAQASKASDAAIRNRAWTVGSGARDSMKKSMAASVIPRRATGATRAARQPSSVKAIPR